MRGNADEGMPLDQPEFLQNLGDGEGLRTKKING